MLFITRLNQDEIKFAKISSIQWYQVSVITSNNTTSNA